MMGTRRPMTTASSPEGIVNNLAKDVTEDELIKHPPHYTRGIECWDYVVSQGLGFLEGNVIKYVTRYRHKNGLEDLLKARQYLERLIQEQGGQAMVKF